MTKAQATPPHKLGGGGRSEAQPNHYATKYFVYAAVVLPGLFALVPAAIYLLTVLGGIRDDIEEIKSRLSTLEADRKNDAHRLDTLENRYNQRFGTDVDGGADGGAQPEPVKPGRAAAQLHNARRTKFCTARCGDTASADYGRCEARFDYCADNFVYYNSEFYKCLAVNFGRATSSGGLYKPLKKHEWQSRYWKTGGVPPEAGVELQDVSPAPGTNFVKPP